MTWPFRALRQVHELRAYRDPLCLVPTTEGNGIASGHHGGEVPSNAFDQVGPMPSYIHLIYI